MSTWSRFEPLSFRMAARPAYHNTNIDMEKIEKTWGRMMWQGKPPFTDPSPMGTPNPPTLDPLSGRLWLHASPVKLETLNAFYGHSRLFAHPKP